MMLEAFFARVSPVSTIANPACMNMTRNPQIRVHAKLTGAFGSPSRVSAPVGS